MNRELPQRILNYLDSRLEDQLELLQRLVEAESPSESHEAQGAVMRILAEPLKAIGYRVKFLPGRRSGGQLFARPDAHTRGTPCQLLLGHSDTVWPEGKLATMPLVREGNVLRGPGAYDMKAGLAKMIFALEALRACSIVPEVTPLVFVSSDEELAAEDSRWRIQLLARRVIRVFVLEPAAGEAGYLKTSRKGIGVFTVNVTGRSAHAGVEPEAGVSAILELSHQIQALQELNDYAAGTTVTVGLVQGGSRANVVPASATAVVDVRARTLADLCRVEQAIRALRPVLPGASIQVLGGVDRPPLERNCRNQRLWHEAKSLGELLGLQLEESETGGGSDGNLTSLFAPTLDGLGAVGGGAHAEHEFIFTDHLVPRTALLALLLASPASRGGH